MKKKEIISLVIFVLVFAFAAYRYSKQTHISQRSEFVMDTLVNIKLGTKQAETDKILDNAFKLITDLENEWSYYKENSLVWNFNNAVVDSIAIDEHLSDMLSISKELFYSTNRRYDITMGALSDVWDFETEKIPTNSEIQEAIKKTGFEKLLKQNGFLHKTQDLKINLGSIVKGMIIDEVVEYLQQQKVNSGFVNAGGDLRIFGRHKPYKIGIQHPRSETNETIDILSVKNRSVVTSGDYERYFIKDEVRYHHIIDPLTGFPAGNAISVTVVAENAILADAYSTALFLMEQNEALELAEEDSRIEAILYYIEKNKIEKLETEGMKEYYER